MAAFISTDAFLAHWQAHRRLTRRMIEAFPDDQLFTFSIGGMRSFGDLCREMLGMTLPMAHGMATEQWDTFSDQPVTDKAELLRKWDETTAELDRVWAQIPASKFGERTTAFGMYEGNVYDLLLYVVDNEIHHRGQGYVYLRALGVEPPPFYVRT